jgi:methylated-DNA-[protein]-cysteine S-methyltransferase
MIPGMAKKNDQPGFYAVWPTAWGPVGGVAGESGLRRLVLPHYQADELADLLAWEHPAAVRDAGPFERVIELSRAYFNGQAVEFDDVACQLPGEGTFGGKVLRACRTLRYGQIASYSELARLIGQPEASRAVAAALGKNNIPLVIPCHRVTYAGGAPGGFSAPGGVEVKCRMLALEARGRSMA